MEAALVAMTSPPTARHYVPPAGGRPERPRAAGVLGVFAHHPDLAQAFFAFNGHVLYGTTLTLRQREILALRTAAVRNSAYLWGQRLAHQDDAGLSASDIAGIAFGPNAPFLDDLDSALLIAADELLTVGALSETSWQRLTPLLDHAQILDVIFTVGCYAMVASLCTSLELEVESDIPPVR
jgi:alkylhydroperoxidase family enzyme